MTRNSEKTPESTEPDPKSRYATELLFQLFDGDEAALGELLNHFWERHESSATRTLHRSPVRHKDGGDAIHSVFAGFLSRVREGEYRNLRTTDDFEPVILAALKNKLRDYVKSERREKRGFGEVTNISSVIQSRLHQIHPRQPELLLQSVLSEILECLSDDVTRGIVVDVLNGDSRREIAAKRGVSERTVYRVLETAKSELREHFWFE